MDGMVEPVHLSCPQFALGCKEQRGKGITLADPGQRIQFKVGILKDPLEGLLLGTAAAADGIWEKEKKQEEEPLGLFSKKDEEEEEEEEKTQN